MRYVTAMAAAFMLASAVCAAAGERANLTDAASRVVVITGKRAADSEKRIAEVLAQRITLRSSVPCAVIGEDQAPDTAADLLIYLGQPQNHDRLAALLADRKVPPLTAKDPGPEGFVVKTARAEDRPVVLAAGFDPRGVIYAAGEILRQITYNDRSIAVADVEVRSAPAYRIRGVSPGDNVAMLEFCFAGANLFYAGGDRFAVAKSYDLLTKPGLEVRPNELWDREYPPEWQSPTERDAYVCPSIPEARKALLDQWDKAFRPGQDPMTTRWSQDFDVLRFASGDPGGCRCPRCSPWGGTYVRLCEEVANIWLKYHPKSEIQITNQDLDNAGERAIWDYLNEKPRKWLSAICYGPGSNAMSSYFRREQRDDLLIYSGDGWINRYLRETLHNLPKYQHVVFMSDITHWISSQYQLPNAEPHLAAVYGRRTFHTRPRQLYWIFHQTMPFSEGDIVYSEGQYDELNQYMWNRMLWDPSRSLEDVLMEYARLYFGPAAAPEMVEAIFQLEQNLQTPLATNDGVDRYYALVKSAGWKIPPHTMRNDFRWRLHMQKAALDKYVQLQLRRQLDMQARVAEAVDVALAGGADAGTAVAAILDEPMETPDMTALRTEAERLAQELAAINPAAGSHFNLTPETPESAQLPEYKRRNYRLDLDFVGLAWTRAQVTRAQEASGPERLRILREMAHYEDPGPGGFYDDLGDKARAPHLVKGQGFRVRGGLDPANRSSQNSIAYSADDGKGVTLRYTGLDPKAHYRVRLTMVAPRRSDMGRFRGPSKQSVVANGRYLARDVEVPQYTAQQFEYDVPPELTKGGELELWLEKAPGAMATLASEVWLIKQ